MSSHHSQPSMSRLRTSPCGQKNAQTAPPEPPTSDLQPAAVGSLAAAVDQLKLAVESSVKFGEFFVERAEAKNARG